MTPIYRICSQTEPTEDDILEATDLFESENDIRLEMDSMYIWDKYGWMSFQ